MMRVPKLREQTSYIQRSPF